MNLISTFLIGLVLCCASIQGQQNSRMGILILGSNHIPTLNERINSGYELFRSLKDVDYIIVSGGCDAHNSGFCEASEMKKLLENKGVSEDLIYKEENSRSTFQNYCFSRKLMNEKGENLIKEGDSLYVVSNHWHAIPVAARFETYDKVHARYFIVGEITPKSEDKVNYSEIFSDKTSDCICDQIE